MRRAHRHGTGRAWGGVALALLVAAGGFAGPARSVAAEDETTPPPKEEKVDLDALQAERERVTSSNRVRPRVSRYLDAAVKAGDKGDPDEAIRLLERIRRSRLNPVEDALVLRMMGFVEYGAERPKKAIEYFRRALAKEALPIKDETRLRFYIAQLNAQAENWKGVIEAIDDWLRYTRDPDPLGYYLRSIAHYQVEEPEAAIADIRRALNSAPEPREQWLRLLAALYSQQQDYVKATPILEQLLLRFQKKEYWVQLSLIYAARNDYDTSLAVQQVAYQQGFLTEDAELRRLARSYLYNDLPYPAAKVLQKGIEDGTIDDDPEVYELLANSWIAAREYDRSLPPLRKAAELAKDGNLDVRLAQVYMQRENWSDATRMLENAIDKGGLKNRGNVELLLGIAYYNTKNLSLARNHFVRAREHEETREAAERWISHLATETSSQAG